MGLEVLLAIEVLLGPKACQEWKVQRVVQAQMDLRENLDPPDQLDLMETVEYLDYLDLLDPWALEDHKDLRVREEI